MTDGTACSVHHQPFVHQVGHAQHDWTPNVMSLQERGPQEAGVSLHEETSHAWLTAWKNLEPNLSLSISCEEALVQHFISAAVLKHHKQPRPSASCCELTLFLFFAGRSRRLPARQLLLCREGHVDSMCAAGRVL